MAGVWSALSDSGEDTSGDVEYEDKYEVELLTAGEMAANRSDLIAYGTAAATEDMDLSFQMNGVLEEVYVEPGAWVEAGDILAMLDDDSMTATLAQAAAGYDAVYNAYKAVESGAGDLDYVSAEISLEMAEVQLEALEDALEAAEDAADEYEDLTGEDVDDLTAYGAPSDAQIEIQELLVEQYENAIRMMREGASDESLATQWAYVMQAEAGMAAALEAYQMVYLKAPISGEITTLGLTEGQYVFATYSVGKIVNRDEIEAVTYLSVEDAAAISVGNSVLIDQEHEGEVIGVSSRVDEATGKLKVRIWMDELYELTSGETVKLEIEKDKASGVTLVPLSAFVFDDGDAYVYFYYDGAVYKRLMETGDVLGDYVEVYSMPDISIAADAGGLSNAQAVSIVESDSSDSADYDSDRD